VILQETEDSSILLTLEDLKTCLQCGYSLAGHSPPEFVCPECGMKYDAETRAVLGRWGIGGSRGFIMIATSWIALATFSSMVIELLGAHDLASIVLLIGIAGLVLYALLVFLKIRPFVAVTVEGVFFRSFRPRFEPDMWSWDDIQARFGDLSDSSSVSRFALATGVRLTARQRSALACAVRRRLRQAGVIDREEVEDA